MSLVLYRQVCMERLITRVLLLDANALPALLALFGHVHEAREKFTIRYRTKLNCNIKTQL